MNRYNRHIVLSEIGQIGQDKLSHAKVLVVGKKIVITESGRDSCFRRN